MHLAGGILHEKTLPTLGQPPSCNNDLWDDGGSGMRQLSAQGANIIANNLQRLPHLEKGNGDCDW